MSLNCIICDERVNKARHALVCCPYCAFEACRTCCETFVLDRTIAQCMNTTCGKEWTRQQIATAFTKAFVNGPWKKNREKVLFDREVALLPATQPLVERAIKQDQIVTHQREVRELKIFFKSTQIVRRSMVNAMHYPLLKDTKEETDAALMAHYWAISKMISDIRFQLNVPVTRSVFVRACPDEHCRGFLSSQWKCGLCEQYACADCHIVKGKTRDCDHTCNPDDVATAKLLASDTKPCPKCATGIFKIDGCDQMWCTQCRTAFSWKTGAIETRIHNPHYYEWARRNNGGVAPRNPGDNAGCAVLDHTIVFDVEDIVKIKLDKYTADITPAIQKKYRDDLVQKEIQKRTSAQKTMASVFCQVTRNTMHLREVELVKYRVDAVEDNADLRVKYMRNLITKELFQKQVQQANKKHDKSREIYGVLQLLITTVTDILHRVKQQIIECDDGEFAEAIQTLSEVDTITEYTNECLVDIADTYCSKSPKNILLY